MDNDNLTLVVGTYADAGAAADDFATLKSGETDGEYQVVGAVVMNRDVSGKVKVEEHGDKNVSQWRQGWRRRRARRRSVRAAAAGSDRGRRRDRRRDRR